ncbi:MAG: response regulator, partial [Methanospirillum sp.]|nr:response regulator [Methanospirillum sp.]
MKILVVEDNLTQAKYLAHLLEGRNHQVAIASNGNEALVQIDTFGPDIVLTDVMMPDMDGYTLCKRIKEDGKTSQIPVIIVTHLYSPVDVIKGLEAGADNFIIKPYDPENIFSRILSITQVRDHPERLEMNDPLNVVFSNEVHTVSSSRMQILNILLSTYDTAVKNNCELQVAHERLHYMNAQL